MKTTAAARWTWKDEPELMARLKAVQNHPSNEHQDIVTYAGYCGGRAALAAHVERYEAKAAEYDAR